MQQIVPFKCVLLKKMEQLALHYIYLDNLQIKKLL